MTELSNKLKEARLSLGLSLDDLQTTTKIQKRYLLALEEGNYSIIPGPFYVRAFIKQYAEAVQLDPDELFAEYKSDIPSTHSEDFPTKLSRVQTRKDVAPGNSKVFAILPRLLIGVFIIGAVALAYFLVVNIKENGETAEEPAKTDSEQIQYEDNLSEKEAGADKETESTEDEDNQTSGANEVTEEETTQVEPPTQQVTVAESKGKETVFELKNADKFEVKLVSTGETWVNLLNGKGHSFWQGILKKGAEENKIIDYSKEEEAVLVIGNSTNTEIYVNDQKLEYATPPADQVRQDITIRFVPTVNE
ncbi:RodZ domain-containing protein [Robertmurraya korlensis]|uniref:RodZ domain-containing protein n=1 Tax=Robertmurraya korlensis TaxID=519977 RepID=UPI0008270AF2|nr:RodZ domain-containing protein [Robertmurraya korlensis]